MGCTESRPDKSPTIITNNENPQNDGNGPPSSDLSDGDKSGDKQPSSPPSLNNIEEDESSVNTVIKIQAGFRGNKVRSTMKHEDGEDVNGGGGGGGNGAAETSSVAGEEEVAASNQSPGDPTKEEMEAEFREDDKELCDAVKKIQSTFRGKAFRKGVDADAASADAADNIEDAAKDEKAAAPSDSSAATPTTPSVEDELADIDMADPGLAKAASMIQGKFRMKRK